jgi:hypothetical protein
VPPSYGVFGGPEIVPVQWRMFSSLEGAAKHDSRGSSWRFMRSLLIRLKVFILVLAELSLGTGAVDQSGDDGTVSFEVN